MAFIEANKTNLFEGESPTLNILSTFRNQFGSFHIFVISLIKNVIIARIMGIDWNILATGNFKGFFTDFCDFVACYF